MDIGINSLMNTLTKVYNTATSGRKINSNRVSDLLSSSYSTAGKGYTFDNMLNSINKGASGIIDNYNGQFTGQQAYNNKLNQQMMQQANDYNAQQAEVQRNWSAMMSNTAHQREVADLQAAGLNPVLSAGGTGATTPSGASANSSQWSGADTAAINAIADLTTAAINNNTQVETARLNAKVDEKIARMQTAANMYNTNQALISSLMGTYGNASTGVYSSKNALKGTKYASKMSYKGTQYAANAGLTGTLANAGAMQSAAATSAAAAMYAAQMGYNSVVYNSDAQKWISSNNLKGTKTGSIWEILGQFEDDTGLSKYDLFGNPGKNTSGRPK